MIRRYSFPEGHWNWPVQLTHHHGVRADNMVFTGGQVDLDSAGDVRNPGDLTAQCQGAMTYLSIVLDDLGVDLDDLVRLIVYFVGDAQAEMCLADQIAAFIGDGPRPVINMIGLPELCYPDMMVEIEGVAMRAPDGARLDRACHHLPDMPALSRSFSHAVACEGMIFTGDMSAMTPDSTVGAPGDLIAQSHIMMDQLGRALTAAGASYDDVRKLNVSYTGSTTAEEWEQPARIRASYFNEPGPAATGIPLPGFPDPSVATKIFVTAMRGAGGTKVKATYAWPEGHWDWTTHLPYKHGNRCGPMIHVGGQVSLDAQAGVIDPGDMVAQTRRAMDNVARVLAEFGATLDDVVKVTTFYQGSASAKALHENLLIRSRSYSVPGPATTGIPMAALVYENMVIEIEVTAMLEDAP